MRFCHLAVVVLAGAVGMEVEREVCTSVSSADSEVGPTPGRNDDRSSRALGTPTGWMSARLTAVVPRTQHSGEMSCSHSTLLVWFESPSLLPAYLHIERIDS